MPVYKVYQVDAFTKEKFRGNPAGVVIDADGLTEAQMKSIARELNNSETAFVFKPDGPDHEVRIRFFTPLVEIPICGHATVSSHYVRALEKNLPSSRIMHKTGIGVLPVDIIRGEGKENDYSIMMSLGTPEFSEPFTGEIRRGILDGLGLEEKDIDSKCPVQVVSTGHSKVMIGIRTKSKLNELVPDPAALIKMSDRTGCKGYFVFTLDSDNSEVLTHGRMFAPAVGVLEDPVTGNAHGPLGAYLVKHKLVRIENDENKFTFTGQQGEAIGRTGQVKVSVGLKDGKPVDVQIGGKAVIVFKTEIEI